MRAVQGAKECGAENSGEDEDLRESPARSPSTHPIPAPSESTLSHPPFHCTSPNTCALHVQPNKFIYPAETLLKSWHPLRLHPQLIYALYNKAFATPTP